MEKAKFSITIDAPKEKVWRVLWNHDSYKIWTSVFSEGSYAVTDWKEGSKVLFLTPEGNGMYSTIFKSIPNEYMSFKHLGVVDKGIEQPNDEETKKWSGAMENYILQEVAGATQLDVEVDVTDELSDFFDQTFPKALEKVKELSEQEDAVGQV